MSNISNCIWSTVKLLCEINLFYDKLNKYETVSIKLMNEQP